MIEDPLGLVGTKIDDKYEVESVVGEGGFAIVYRAKHLIFKRYVAIKAFRALTDYSMAERDTLVQAFIQEGALLADLSERSAAIVQARDFGTLTTAKGEWIPYMVLEWLEGSSLDAVLEHDVAEGVPPRSLEDAVKLLEPAAEALALAHKRGVAHRDVKPANIFVIGDPRGDATVKLLDFGIAKVVQDAQKAAGSFTKTSGQVTSFTPAYGAPEQFDRSHGATGPWTDVFALALVAVEMLTHQAPLQGDTFVQLGFAAGNPAKRPTPRALGASVTDEVEAVFAKALSVRSEERYAGAGEFWNALREALHMKPMRMSMVDSGPRSQPAMTASFSTANTLAVPASSTATPVVQASSVTVRPPPKHAGLFVAAAAVVLLAGGGGVFMVLHGGGSATGSQAASASASATPHVAVVKPLPSCPKTMVFVDGGEFFMGSNDAKADDNEKPSHHVELSAFCIDRTEVTVAAYKACSDVGKCPPASRENSFSGLDDKLKKVLDPLCNVREAQGKGEHPINCIDWESSATYCAKQGGRLPTEAEWEFAARGPDG
ncbi:MAG TPA: bifunctional serine/threonine-protein kinase/formylglycine-generating enzyme family protein, partial [Polyangiaceae bacterium]